MSNTDLAQAVAQYPWFHSIDLGNGVVTKGDKPLDMIQFECAAFFDPIDLKGRSVIDIGAWNGAYSIEAKRRGAQRVLATDHYVWNMPNWRSIAQADAPVSFRGRETFDLVVSTLGLDIEAQDIDVSDLDPTLLGTFDVVLFLGVFYHLLDPLDGLTRAARLAKEVLVVESQVDLYDLKRPAMVFYPGSELNNDPTNWWGPNPMCLYLLLRQLGFDCIDARYGTGRGRVIFHAWRSPALRRSGPPNDPELAADLNPAADVNVGTDLNPAVERAPQAVGRREKLRAGLRLILEGLQFRGH
jgi:tRNA (mo5U34)-methyltransferase